EHGVSSNTTFDPFGVNKEGWYWYASDIKAPTLWAVATQAKLMTAAVNWPVTAGDPNINYLVPEYWRASTVDDIKLIRVLARPIGFLEGYEKQLGSYVDGDTNTIEADRVRTRFALKLIADKHPDFMALHLAAFDEIEHDDGPFQTTAFAALEALDAMIGELRKAALAANPRTVVVIVSDHGFRATQSTVNLRVPLVNAGLIKLKPAAPNKLPQVASWDAQVWLSGGSAAIVLHDRKDEKVPKQVDALLTQLKSDAHNGIARVLNADDVHKRGGFPEADWVVECAPGFYVGGALRGELIAPAPMKGMHGYVPDQSAMHASFFMQGAGVGKHTVGVVDMRQLAPTFAKILGVKLPSATQSPIAFE
ncbi:MAG TPA: alkaline phosphatase family protein, partial [Steroidobacteraceae bacterium]|nr:alkaline phosphatase family protein [Steroidobacteraceae bacterium]